MCIRDRARGGWTDGKNGMECVNLQITGESLSGDVEAAEKFKKEFEDFIKKEELTADQVYNADESGLFYRMLPSSLKIRRFSERE